MDGIGKDLFAKMASTMGMDSLKGDQLQQAENIWKMLDDLSENNPDGYKSFVKSNMEHGFEDLKKEKDKKIDSLKVQAQPMMLLKMQATLQSMKLEKDQHPLYDKLRFDKQEKQINVQELRKKLDKEVKIYVNLLSHSRVRKVLNDQGKEMTNLKEVEKWKVIPYSIQDATQRKSESLGNLVYFYEFVINDEVCKMMVSQPLFTEQLITFVIDKMKTCLQQHRNPLLKQYDYMSVNEILYYSITKMSVVRHKSKVYKNVDNKIKAPPPLILEPEADREYDLDKVRQQLLQQQQQQQGSGDLQNNNTKFEAPIKNTNDVTERQKKEEQERDKINEESVLDGLRIVSKEEKEKSTKPKKVMIQEITPETIKEEKKKVQFEEQKKPKIVEVKKEKSAKEIVEESLEKPSFLLRELSECLYIEITLLKVDSINDMILDVGTKKLKLEVPLVYRLEVQFPIEINNSEISPKWSKKTKILKLTLPKVK